QVVARSLEAVRPLMDARRHRLNVDMMDSTLWVQGDATRLAQVLQNLLTNAAKYTPEGGLIELNVWQEGSRLHTSVRDNGVGLSPQDIEQIFQLFSQGESQSAARESGLGIGLTLARSLVEMHGGALGASSPGLGLGSTFSFFLPNAGSASTDTADTTTEPARPLVMIVDDNRDAANSLAEILRLMDCQVKVAYDGASALQLARLEMPKVIVLELGR